MLVLCLTCCLAPFTVVSGPVTKAPAEPTVGSGNRPTDFAPGVRIDWQQRRVEVDAEVVLREGMLELLACSPNTKEHESILRVHARPLHIYQAMGLIGLEPGTPARYHEKQRRMLPPEGESVLLHVRYRQAGTPRVIPIERWLLDAKRQRPPDKVRWLFTGSRTFDGGRFGADLDGTVVGVVDFDTSLITADGLHSADNELLWLEANTKAIPPVGTRCTLLIQRASPPPLEIVVDRDGTLRHEGNALSTEQVARMLGDKRPPSAGRRLLLRVEKAFPDAALQTLIESLKRAGVDRGKIDLRRPPSPADRTPPGKSTGTG